MSDVKRCPVCDWPMADSRAEGCVSGDCCYRPDPQSDEGRRIQRRRAELDCLAAVTAERDALRRFKEWVHGSLDAHGVPHDPDPDQTRETGCRISGRMKWLVDRANAANGVTP